VVCARNEIVEKSFLFGGTLKVIDVVLDLLHSHLTKEQP
jgi:hypothetical protein